MEAFALNTRAPKYTIAAPCMMGASVVKMLRGAKASGVRRA